MRTRWILLGVGALALVAPGCSALWDSMARLDPAQAAEIGKTAGTIAGQTQPGLGIGPEIGATLGTILAFGIVAGLRYLGKTMGGKPKV